MTRREFITGASGLLAAPLIGRAGLARTGRIKAVAFDAFPIFDPRPIAALAESLFPGRGAVLMEAWRTRQFEYTWLRMAEHNYADFWQVTGDALDFAADKVKVDVEKSSRQSLMNAYLELKPWPDVPPALKALRDKGIRLAFLSNFTLPMLQACIKTSELEGVFEKVISTDQARTFKPDPKAYQLGVSELKLRKDEILFAAFAGWDAAGGKQFGYPTFWVNRQSQPAEHLGAFPDATGAGLAQLVDFVEARNQSLPF